MCSLLTLKKKKTEEKQLINWQAYSSTDLQPPSRDFHGVCMTESLSWLVPQMFW